jgi:hypothetical protein
LRCLFPFFVFSPSLWSCPVLSCPVLSCPVLVLVLSCPCPCPVLPYAAYLPSFQPSVLSLFLPSPYSNSARPSVRLSVRQSFPPHVLRTLVPLVPSFHRSLFRSEVRTKKRPFQSDVASCRWLSVVQGLRTGKTTNLDMEASDTKLIKNMKASRRGGDICRKEAGWRA